MTAVTGSTIFAALLALGMLMATGCSEEVEIPPDIERKAEQLGDPLISAITSNNIEAVRINLKTGADPNSQIDRELPPLHAAASVGHVDIGRLLIEHNADVNLASTSIITDDEGNSVERIGSMPLHVAVVHNQFDFVEMLISKNASINALDGRELTPLDIATGKGHFLAQLEQITTDPTRLAELSEQVPANQSIQAALRSHGGKTTEEIARAKLEHDIEAHKGKSFLDKTKERLEHSKTIVDSKKNPGTKSPLTPDSGTDLDDGDIDDVPPSDLPNRLLSEPLKPLDASPSVDDKIGLTGDTKE